MREYLRTHWWARYLGGILLIVGLPIWLPLLLLWFILDNAADSFVNIPFWEDK